MSNVLSVDFNTTCQICGNPAIEKSSIGELQFIDCPVCGNYEITNRAISMLINNPNEYQKAKVSHWIRKHFNANNRVQINEVVLDDILTNFELPKPIEQADNFLIWLGNKLDSISDNFRIGLKQLVPMIGTRDIRDVIYIVSYLTDQKLITSKIFGGTDFLGGLTFLGWKKYYDLKRSNKESRLAFMAMKFGDSVLNKIFENTIRKAVKETGFEIRKLDEEKRAGLIDDKLRVEIRRSKFLIADLTHDNNGAYWEAGFAEGLGLPVIYICEETKFQKDKTHFDTNHNLTLKWKNEENALKLFAEDLKATIRATFPNEAIMEDKNEEN
jgi:nucleoside 2-deoxyribosyltransferase